MQLEIYSLTALKDQISVSLEAICDSYSSLLWDIEFYQCGCFEVYIAASPQNVKTFQRGRIVARSDDAQHFGIIESLQLETDAEKGDYLTVTGRFLTCLLERRIIYPTITANGSYEDIVRKVLSRNAISAGIRNLPGFSMGTVSGDCWQKTARTQVSYDNILEWLYSLCETIGGSANVRLDGNATFFPEQTAAFCRITIPTLYSPMRTTTCYPFPMRRTMLCRKTSPMCWAAVKEMPENARPSVPVQSRPILTAMRCMWMSETPHRKKM